MVRPPVCARLRACVRRYIRVCVRARVRAFGCRRVCFCVHACMRAMALLREFVRAWGGCARARVRVFVRNPAVTQAGLEDRRCRVASQASACAAWAARTPLDASAGNHSPRPSRPRAPAAAAIRMPPPFADVIRPSFINGIRPSVVAIRAPPRQASAWRSLAVDGMSPRD